MNDKKREALRAKLESLPGNERQKLYKQAARLKKMSRGLSKSRREPKHVQDWLDGDPDDGHDVVPMKARGADSVGTWMERLVEEEHGVGEDSPPRSVTDRGLVLGLNPGRCHVVVEHSESDPEVFECLLRDHLARTQQTALAVGDRVQISRLDSTDGPRGVVEMVEPRRTCLTRPDPGGRKPGGRILERAIAANIDVVVIVAAGKTPPLRAGLIDRYLVAIERGGASPVICLNKTDLLAQQELEHARSILAVYQDFGVPVVTCSATEATGIVPIRSLLAGQTAVLVGHSGVGKSSLVNALEPRLALGTRSVSEGSGKGRHTTTASTLYQLDAATRIIDTPGIREFGIMPLSASELRYYFHDFDDPAGRCRFADCTHNHEPDCGVKQAVENGTVSKRRYATYAELLGETK